MLLKTSQNLATGSLVHAAYLIDLQALTILSITCLGLLNTPITPVIPTSKLHPALPGLLLGLPNWTPAIPLPCPGLLSCWGQNDLFELQKWTGPAV